MRKICFLLVFLIFQFIAYASDIPQPLGWVNDFAGVLSQQDKEKLSTLIEELEQKTTTEIAVVTVNSIAPYDEKEYARLLFDNWKPGKKGKDNGVLVLLAIKERRWRIETGYGVEGILPDGLCGNIGRNYMVPYFKKGNYGEGLYSGVQAIARVVAQEKKISINNLKQAKLFKNAWEQTIFSIVIALIIISFLPWPFEKFPWLYSLWWFIAIFTVGILNGFARHSRLGMLTFFIFVILVLFLRLSGGKHSGRRRRGFFYSSGSWGGGWGGGGFGGGGGGGFGGGGGGGGGAGGGF